MTAILRYWESVFSFAPFHSDSANVQKRTSARVSIFPVLCLVTPFDWLGGIPTPADRFPLIPWLREARPCRTQAYKGIEWTLSARLRDSAGYLRTPCIAGASASTPDCESVGLLQRNSDPCHCS